MEDDDVNDSVPIRRIIAFTRWVPKIVVVAAYPARQFYRPERGKQVSGTHFLRVQEPSKALTDDHTMHTYSMLRRGRSGKSSWLSEQADSASLTSVDT